MDIDFISTNLIFFVKKQTNFSCSLAIKLFVWLFVLRDQTNVTQIKFRVPTYEKTTYLGNMLHVVHGKLINSFRNAREINQIGFLKHSKPKASDLLLRFQFCIFYFSTGKPRPLGQTKKKTWKAAVFRWLCNYLASIQQKRYGRKYSRQNWKKWPQVLDYTSRPCKTKV